MNENVQFLLHSRLMLALDANIQTAKEDYPEKTLEEQIVIARDWTVESASKTLHEIAEERKCEHQEATNKAHFG